MRNALNPTQMRTGKRFYNLFQGIGALAFPLVNGSIITLYAIKIGASSLSIGLIASFNYLAFMMVPIGKYFIPKNSPAKIMSIGMTVRYLFLIPILLIPLFLKLKVPQSAHLVLIFSSLIFNIFRGIALVGQNPIVDQICSDTKDRSRYLAINFTIMFLFTIISNLSLALILRFISDSQLVYILLFSIGIIAGIISGLFLFKIPFKNQETNNPKVFKVFKEAWMQKSFKYFFICHFGISLISALVRPFIIVYSKTYFGISDGMAIFVSTAGAIGSFIMGLFTRAIINFVGSKTLYILFMVIACFSLVPIIISPTLNGNAALIFLFIINFIASFSLQGTESNAQNYFFTIARKDELVELSIIFFMIFGLAGTIGSTLGGYLLDVFSIIFRNNIHDTFRFYFLIALILSLIMLYRLHTLQNTGRHSVLKSFGFMLNIRDLKAIGLANKLESYIESTDEQRKILKKIGSTDSSAPADLLIDSLASPRHLVRYETLITIANIKNLKDTRLIKTLINYIKSPSATSTFMAINILGQNKIKEVLPIVKETIHSNDYMIKAESIRALGHLRDYESITIIEAELKPTNHEYVLIQSISALERLYTKEEACKLFKVLSWKNYLHHGLEGEILLAIARVLNFEGFFYRFYTTYLQNKDLAYEELRDQYSTNIRHLGTDYFVENLINSSSQRTYFKNIQSFIKHKPLLQHLKNESIVNDFNRFAINPIVFRYHHVRFFFIVIALITHLKIHHSNIKH